DGEPITVPGKSADSRLIQLTSGVLEDEVMPPKGQRLSARQVGLLRAWIDQGLPWNENAAESRSNHWAFQPIKTPAVPKPRRRDWIRTPVDAFIAMQHETHGLRPSPAAARQTLIRRLSLVLLGLPPTSRQARDFTADSSPDAYEALVDQLLSSPRYGEHWGRHWLDVARWAETEGYESNHPRPFSWRYRDYVIRAFNEDKAYNQFLRQQIAGDLMEPYADENLIATGFLAAARLSSNEEDKALQRNDLLVDIVNATSSAVMGLTLACAQCHDHKFDPLTQRDYYRFQAFFITGQPRRLLLRDPELWKDFNAKRPGEYHALRELRIALYRKGVRARNELTSKEFSEEQLKAIETPESTRTAEQHRLYRQASLRMQATPGGFEKHIPDEDKILYNEAKKKLAKLAEQGVFEPMTWGYYAPQSSPHKIETRDNKAFYPLPYVPAQLAEKQAYLLERGDPHSRGESLATGLPGALRPPSQDQRREPPIHNPKSRLDLADWLTGPDHPLTARVWVNRIWRHHFGRGIVATPGDFGLEGAKPSHPKLLDWLAAELINSGWSTKHIHRLVLNSNTYRQASATTPGLEQDGCLARDPDNHYLWRWTPRRLQHEAIRDACLFVSGELDTTMGGESAALDESAPSKRRSVYLYQKRDVFTAMHKLFDGPTANASCSRRSTSTIALQPLFLLNNPFMVDCAEGLAARVRRQAGAEREPRIRLAFRVALGRSPDQIELRAAAKFFDGLSAAGAMEDHDETETATPLGQFCLALLNLNEFVYID
ncbi:MAG: PSD1 and planctomycete cytochrome C domain-containing protein, partial [Planctomycetales bacterium]